jgi:hypothetical protein
MVSADPTWLDDDDMSIDNDKSYSDGNGDYDK